MPLSLKLNNENYTFGLWTVNESIEELKKYFEDAPSEEQENLKKFKNPSRQIEWMATRKLIYELLNKKVIIDYDEFGKPSIRNSDKQISISHTKGLVAVQISEEIAGVDVELVSERVAKIAHKFLNTPELSSLDLNNQMLHMYAHWCAKETVYKIYGKKRLDFKKNIIIEAFKIENEGYIKAKLQTKEVKIYNLKYFVYEADNNNYMVVICE